jgi:predicted transcriptional regulator of viral defense system
MRSIPWEAQHQFGVFTATQAFAAGWSQSALNRAVRSGRFDRLRRGAYAPVASRDDMTSHEAGRFFLAQQSVAASLCLPRATISHAAAAAVHGLPMLHTPSVPCLTFPPGIRTFEAGIHLHRQQLPLWQVDHRLDVPVTSAARACLDLCREAGLAAGLVSADSTLAKGKTTRDELERVYRSLRGRAGTPDGSRLIVGGHGRLPVDGHEAARWWP